jgi:D-alanyl-D-alanine carboxypeptidase
MHGGSNEARACDVTRSIAAGFVVFALLTAGCAGATAKRPDLQQTLDSLVSGASRVAPGAVAYVSGPKGTWLGASGWANAKQREAMTPDTRSRLGSVSKLWTAAVVLKLAETHQLRLNDAVGHWLPGLFPYGKRITIRELLQQTSGMIDDNDIQNQPEYWLSKIHDPKLRTQLLKLGEKMSREPSITVPALFEMRVAAALPLLFEPGTQYHYTNIGYKTLGVIAERAGHASLDALYHRYIIEPLELRHTGYDPTAVVRGEHATPYIVKNQGKLVDATRLDMGGLEGSGGIVSDARDEARFLTALMQGKIVSPTLVAELQTPSEVTSYGFGTAVSIMCGDTVFTHGGATRATMAEVAVNRDGSRVTVLLLNGRTWNSSGDTQPEQALQSLYCAS